MSRLRLAVNSAVPPINWSCQVEDENQETKATAARVDCGRFERPQEALEGEDACRQNIERDEAHHWCPQTKSASPRYRPRTSALSARQRPHNPCSSKSLRHVETGNDSWRFTATMITQPALGSSPQSRPAPTSRALPPNHAAQRVNKRRLTTTVQNAQHEACNPGPIGQILNPVAVLDRTSIDTRT